MTIRALRVYERQGLIRPPRAANGWRRYGEEELTRLNVIRALKSLGLTLIQIRAILDGGSASPVQLLHIQLQAWRVRRSEAERTVTLLESALARGESQRPLSIYEFCDLIRSTQMTDVRVISRELLNELITPEEERAWLTWWSQRPKEDAYRMAQWSEGWGRLFRALDGLAQRAGAHRAQGPRFVGGGTGTGTTV